MAAKRRGLTPDVGYNLSVLCLSRERQLGLLLKAIYRRQEAVRTERRATRACGRWCQFGPVVYNPYFY